MIKADIQQIYPLKRLQDNSERFQVELGDTKEARTFISNLNLLEPGTELVNIILTREEWQILEKALNELNG